VGAVLGALHFAARTHYHGLARWIAAMSVVCSGGLIIFSQSRVFWLSCLVLFIVGFVATSQMAATNTTVQNRSPEQLRGRLMAVYATMFMGVQPIGALLAGVVAKRIGAPNTMAVFGGICLVGSLLFAAWVLLRVRPAAEAEPVGARSTGNEREVRAAELIEKQVGAVAETDGDHSIF